MTDAADRASASPPEPLRRLVRAGLLCGVVDLLWALVLTAVYGNPVLRLFQGIAATAFGAAMFDRGWGSAALGLVLHFCVAFWWSGVFLVLVLASARLRQTLASRGGVAAAAALYGPLVWIAMSCAVIPLLTGRAPSLNVRWWIQIPGHALFVGLPIVWAIARPSSIRSPT